MFLFWVTYNSGIVGISLSTTKNQIGDTGFPGEMEKKEVSRSLAFFFYKIKDAKIIGNASSKFPSNFSDFSQKVLKGFFFPLYEQVVNVGFWVSAPFNRIYRNKNKVERFSCAVYSTDWYVRHAFKRSLSTYFICTD